MLVKMLLYAKLVSWLEKYGFRRYTLHKSKYEESTKYRQILISKIYDAQVFWKRLERFQENIPEEVIFG